MARSSGTHTTSRMKLSISAATQRFQKPTYSTGPAPTVASGKPDELLAKVFAFQQADEGLRRLLEPLRHALAVLDLSRRDPARELGQRLRPELHAVGDDEALHLDPVGE